MSINHLIDSQTVPRYDLFCNDLQVDGDVTNTGTISTPEIDTGLLQVSSDLSVGTDLVKVQDIVFTSTISQGGILVKCPSPVIDGFVDISTPIFRTVIRKTETVNKIIRQYTFECTSAPSSLNSTLYRLNFKPVVPFDTAGLDLQVSYLSFSVFDNGGVTSCGTIDTSGNPAVGERTLVSNIFTGTPPALSNPKTVLIKITTNENKL